MEIRTKAQAEAEARRMHPDQTVSKVIDNGPWFTVSMSGGDVLIPKA